MKKIILLFFFSIFTFLLSTAQTPLVKQWDARFGGSSSDQLSMLQQTSDGGYILGGSSSSYFVGGDKTEVGKGVDDYWIVKIDSIGIKQWDRTFGGNSMDELYSVKQTKDKGYILGGWTESDNSGDVTQPSRGDADYWIVKTDSLGNKQWDKRFGGGANDNLRSLEQTRDGGYILGGLSYSGAGEDKTQQSWGNWDYWIVKIDSLGNKQWDKDFGGSGLDDLYSVHQTKDNGYILGGYSTSPVNGDKTRPTKDTTVGAGDYWVVKIDSLGNKQWDKDYGGTDADWLMSNNIIQTMDGGYIIGGSSFSGLGADKTQISQGAWDYWVVKIDSAGNKQWDKDYGGSNSEQYLVNISQTSDRGYLFSGESGSNKGGDKSEDNLSSQQSWMVKTDSLGNKLWDKTIFSIAPYGDQNGFAIQTGDGGYAIANSTDSDTGGYKTQMSRGASDYWIVKFRDTGCVSVKSGSLVASSENICSGSGVQLGAIGSSGNLQWQSSSDGILFNDILSANSSSYNSANLTQTNYYRLKASGSCGAKFSSVEVIVVNPKPDAGLIMSNPDSVCSGSSSLLITSGLIGNLQWQSSPDGIFFTNIPSANDTLYNTPTLMQTTYYRVKTSNSCGLDSSSIITVNLLPTPVAGISTLTRDSICAGTGITSQLSVSGGSGGIQWQSSTDGIHFAPIAGATSVTYTTPRALAQTTYYRVMDVNSCGSDSSNIIIVHIIPAPSVRFNYSVNGKQVNFQADSASFNVTSYSWDFGDNQVTKQINPSHTFDSAKTYYVCLTVFNGSNCSYTYCRYVSTLGTGIETVSGGQTIQLYPNPANNTLNLSINGLQGNYQLKIYNVLGQPVKQMNVYFNEFGNAVIDLENMAEGAYELALLNEAEYFHAEFVHLK